MARQRQGMSATVSARACACARGVAARSPSLACSHCLLAAAAAATRRAPSCSTTSPHPRPWKAIGVRRRAAPSSAPRTGRSGRGAAPRFRPRRHGGLRASRGARCRSICRRTTRSRFYVRARRAGQRLPVQADRRERRQRLVVQPARTSRFRATGSRSRSRSGRSISRGGRRRIARSAHAATHRIRRRRRARRRRRLGLCQPPGAAASCRRARAAAVARRRARARRSARRRRPRSRSTATSRPRGRSDPGAGPEQRSSSISACRANSAASSLRWRAGQLASRYDVAVLRRRRAVAHGAQRRRRRRRHSTRIALPESETRYLRLALHDGPARAYGLAEIEVKDLAFGASPNAFFQALARECAARPLSARLLAASSRLDDRRRRRRQRDGAAVGGRRARSGARRLLDRAVRRRGLAGRHLGRRRGAAIPRRRLPADAGRHLARVRNGAARTTFAAGDRDASRARRALRRPQPRRIGRCRSTLVLAVRPFQVNPPAQFLNAPGGVSAIDDDRVGRRSASPSTAAARCSR